MLVLAMEEKETKHPQKTLHVTQAQCILLNGSIRILRIDRIKAYREYNY